MKKVVIIFVLLGIIVGTFSVIFLSNKNNTRNKDYGDIMEYALEDDDWKDYVTFSDAYENIAMYTINRHIDYLLFSQRFNEYLDMNPSYFLNQNYKILINFDFKATNRYSAMILMNHEDGSSNINKHLYVIQILDWSMMSELRCSDYSLGGIECIEVDRAALNKHYESMIDCFPNVKRIITDSIDDVINKKIIEYAKSKGMNIVIKYVDF